MPQAAFQRGTGVFDEPMSSFFRNVDARRSPAAEIGLGDGTRPISSLRARAVLVDMEEGVVSQVMRSPLAELFDR
jgi:tubulin epsilon